MIHSLHYSSNWDCPSVPFVRLYHWKWLLMLMAKSFILVAGICKHICDKFSCLNGSFKKPGFCCWKSVISISVFLCMLWLKDINWMWKRRPLTDFVYSLSIFTLFKINLVRPKIFCPKQSFCLSLGIVGPVSR